MAIPYISAGNLARNVAWAARKDLRSPILKSIVRQEELQNLRTTIEIKTTETFTGTRTSSVTETKSVKKNLAARLSSIFLLLLLSCTQI